MRGTNMLGVPGEGQAVSSSAVPKMQTFVEGRRRARRIRERALVCSLSQQNTGRACPEARVLIKIESVNG
jgi:hypothetical protein